MKANMVDQAITERYPVYPGEATFASEEVKTLIVEGDDFYVVCNKDGWTEIYNKAFEFVSREVFLNIYKIEAGRHITVTLKNGWSEVYDKDLHMLSVKFNGDKK